MIKWLGTALILIWGVLSIVALFATVGFLTQLFIWHGSLKITNLIVSGFVQTAFVGLWLWVICYMMFFVWEVFEFQLFPVVKKFHDFIWDNSNG